jgi:preprotein translocase subunit SecG
MMGFVSTLIMFLLVVVAIFLILLILIQRGRGGGLAGAFGGMGGQSAFGTKAGDVFTRVTIGTATVWILLCATSVKILGSGESRFASDMGGAAKQQQEVPGAGGTAGPGAPGKPAAGTATTGEEATGDKSTGDKAAPADDQSPTAGDAPAGDAAPAESEKPPAEGKTDAAGDKVPSGK